MLDVHIPTTRHSPTRRCPKCGVELPFEAEFCHLDGTPLDTDGEDDGAEEPDPYLGKVLFDQFEVREILGSGGMGTVYKAIQREIDRPVAVKVLHPEMIRDPDVVHRFKREARLASRIENPHLATVHSFGELPDGNLCLVMEYLDGRHLAEVLRESGPMSLTRVVHLLGQVGDVLGDAHALGIVHRDLKPENVMVVRRRGDPDFVKVLDFGIARQIDTHSHATQHGLVFGTARYISPEGARGETATSRSDVYSLGVMAYELLGGEPPFVAAGAMQLLLMHVQDEPPPLRSKAAARGLPEAVLALIHRCLSKDPEQRPADGRAFAAALRAAAGTAAPASAGPVEAEVEPPPLHEDAPDDDVYDVHGRPTSRPPGRLSSPSDAPSLPVSAGRRLVPVAAVLAVVLAVVVLLLRGGGEADPSVVRLVRSAEAAFAEARYDGPEGAIALSDEALRRRPESPAALDLRRRMALALREEARQEEREGHLREAMRALALYERLRPDDEDARSKRLRLEANLPAIPLPVGELPPDAGPVPAKRPVRVAPGTAVVSVDPPRVFAGDAVTLVARARAFGDEGLGRSHFHVRPTGRTRASAVTIASRATGREDEYAASHVFGEPGRYEVAFSSHVGPRHIDGIVQVNVEARPQEPEPSTGQPATSAPEPATSEPATAEPATSAPEPATSAPAEPATSAPDPVPDPPASTG